MAARHMNTSPTLKRIERSSLILFLVCMIATAVLFVALMWIEPRGEVWFKTMATVFVVGFASFLIWLPIILYKLIKR